jgi:hypothetical protein
VHVSGDLTTCCLDDHLRNRLGNLAESSLDDLWSGATLHSWRIAQIEGRFEESGPFCDDCNWRSAGFFPPDRVREYLERTDERDVLRRWEERRRRD